MLAFLSTAYPMEAMDGELQAALGSVPLIGCRTIGELTDGRSLRHTRSMLESASADGEFECVQELLGPLPVAGFDTYGEIARTHGAGGFHNQTLVAVALA